MRGAFLLKTENGQYQLVNVQPSLTTASPNTGLPAGLRFQVPVSTSNAAPVGQVLRNMAPQQMTVTLPVSMASSIRPVSQPVTQPLSIQTTANAAATPSQVMMKAPKGGEISLETYPFSI